MSNAITHATLIEASRRTIANAARVASDSAFAASEARRIYGGNLRGKAQRHQKFARLTLRRAAEFGLTIQKPYKIVRDGECAAVVGMLGDIACPLWHVKAAA